MIVEEKVVLVLIRVLLLVLPGVGKEPLSLGGPGGR